MIEMTKSITFIHAADLHLDSPFKGLANIPESIFIEVKNSTFKALDNLVAVAISRQVDFVLLVGDLFDNDKQSLKAQIKLKSAFEQLEEHKIQVYLSYGNHDYLNGNIHPIHYPKNVHIFPGESVTEFVYEKGGEPLAAIYGFSYENRAVVGSKMDEYVKGDGDIPFHIGTIHGSLHGDQIHDTYAPFSLSELQEKSFDYWALGHIHTRALLADRPPIVYPGNIQGRHRNEAGKKGCYIVEMTEGNVELEFVETGEIIFESVSLELGNYELRTTLGQEIAAKLAGSNVKKLIHLTLTTKDARWQDFDGDGSLGEIMEIMNDTLGSVAIWQYIYRFKLVIENLHQVDYSDFFVGEMMKTLDTLSIDETLKGLYNKPDAKRFLESVDVEEVRNEARYQLLSELLRVERDDGS